MLAIAARGFGAAKRPDLTGTYKVGLARVSWVCTSSFFFKYLGYFLAMLVNIVS